MRRTLSEFVEALRPNASTRIKEESSQWNSVTNRYPLGLEDASSFHDGLRITQRLIHSVGRDTEMTLAKRFARTRGAPQTVDGIVVHNIYRRDVSSGTRICVRRASVTDGAVQGLCLKVANGFLIVNGQRQEDIVLWSDTAPSNVEVICEPRGSLGEFRAWNCWRDSEGTMHAWTGDAGIVIEEIDGKVRLHCSAGNHPFTPSDLVVEFTFVGPE